MIQKNGWPDLLRIIYDHALPRAASCLSLSVFVCACARLRYAYMHFGLVQTICRMTKTKERERKPNLRDCEILLMFNNHTTIKSTISHLYVFFFSVWPPTIACGSVCCVIHSPLHTLLSKFICGDYIFFCVFNVVSGIVCAVLSVETMVLGESAICV